MARPKMKTETTGGAAATLDRPRTGKAAETRPATDPYQTFDALMASAGLDSRLAAFAESGATPAELQAALTEHLGVALTRWGLGLHHLTHEARPETGEDGPDIALLTDGRVTARLSEGAAAVARAYASLTAPDERGLSAWPALGEGHRLAADAPATHLKILIEDARDFETEWITARGGTHHRVWRRGETLHVEVVRPAPPETALADAAWDVITSIKDRTFQRELMRRSDEHGMLGALLGARHAGAGDALSRLPEAHFAVQAMHGTLTGPDARSADAYRTLLRTLGTELEQVQAQATRQLAELLKHGLNRA